MRRSESPARPRGWGGVRFDYAVRMSLGVGYWLLVGTIGWCLIYTQAPDPVLLQLDV
jgi:hypothetical protein